MIHFAGLKAVGESVEKPLRYYNNNVGGTLNLLQAMEPHDVRTWSSVPRPPCTAPPRKCRRPRRLPLDATNPYGRTKEQIEDILPDLGAADAAWHIALLRYFNPVGAHASGRIGEDPHGIPNNLMPFVAQVAVGPPRKLMVFGNDYPTPDGTGMRDYIHVVDLAAGHLAALDHLRERPACRRWNLGTGKGSSVLEVLARVRAAVGHPVPYEFAPRRPATRRRSYADASAALAELGWSATKTWTQMCEDHWRWQKNNPNGYAA